MSIVVVDSKARYRGVLDTYPNARAAYSIARRLNTNYTGSCFRVRRSSDNAELDIGFSNNSMDSTTLLGFCGSGDGFVVSLYDQSNNGLTLTQATAGFQPRIVNVGTLTTINGRPAMYWLDNVRALAGSSAADWKFLNDGTLHSIYSVFQAGIAASPETSYPIMGTNNGTTANTGFYLSYNDAAAIENRLEYLLTNSSGAIATVPIENLAADNSLSANAQHIVSILNDPSNATVASRSDIRVDSVTIIQNNTRAGAVNNANPAFPLMIGGYGSAKGLIGYFQEAIFYPIKQSSSDNTLIENNLLAYY